MHRASSRPNRWPKVRLFSEFPELCGVEQEIVNRFKYKKLEGASSILCANYEERVKEADPAHMNPSPGNVKDGLITDAIKSAGAAERGTSPIVDVFDYPGWVKEGLSLLCTAGVM